MIPINNRLVSGLLDTHYLALKNYLDGSGMKKKFETIEALVSEFSNNAYTFKTLVTSSFNDISNNIVPLWNKFSTERKNDYKESLHTIGLLYSYLSYKNKFKYTNSLGAKKDYDTNYIFSHLKVNVCPYCNENYTYYFNNSGKRNYDFDHFFSQDAYPILAVSLYNLVPSCKVCNFFKKAKPDSILSPYFPYKINDILKWGLNIKSSDYLYDETKFDIIIKHLTSLKDLNNISNNISVFELKGRYEQRKDIVMDTLKKQQLYNEDYVKQLFRSYEGKLFKNIEDVWSMIFNVYLSEEEFSNRPFSKLIYDIFNSN